MVFYTTFVSIANSRVYPRTSCHGRHIVYMNHDASVYRDGGIVSPLTQPGSLDLTALHLLVAKNSHLLF